MQHTLDLLSKAAILLHDAASSTPRQSNLHDELENLAEQLDRVQSAVANNEYDEVGMER
jgi:hypothetical protein